MNRNELINEVKKYFLIKELVCPHVLNQFGEKAWLFLSTELLSTLYVLRTKVINKPMIINSGTTYTLRGLRCNRCELVKSKTRPYLSGHLLGKAVDFHVSGVLSEDIRQLIKANLDKFEYPIRLEEAVSWCHIDCYTLDSDVKLVTFTD